jgi:hypothetical protein
MSHLSRSRIAATVSAALACVAAACSSTSTSGGSSVGSTARPESRPPMSEQEMMARMAELGTPGPHHKELMQQAGTWSVHYKFRMSPDQPWMETTGSNTSKPVLGGRYLMEEHRFEMMGMPMEGWLFIGYDNESNEFISLWMDTSSTWWSESRGKEASDGSVRMTGTMKDAAGERPYRMRIVHESDGTIVSEMYDTIEGEEVLVMTMTSRRGK